MSCVYGVPPIILHVHTLTFLSHSLRSVGPESSEGTDERSESGKDGP